MGSRTISFLVGFAVVLAVVHGATEPVLNPMSLLLLGSGAIGLGSWLRKLSSRRPDRNI